MTMKCQELWKRRGVQVAVAEAFPLPMARKKSGSRSSEPHPCPNAREQLEHVAHKKYVAIKRYAAPRGGEYSLQRGTLCFRHGRVGSADRGYARDLSSPLRTAVEQALLYRQVGPRLGLLHRRVLQRLRRARIP
jgi:hypothetical protein